MHSAIKRKYIFFFNKSCIDIEALRVFEIAPWTRSRRCVIGCDPSRTRGRGGWGRIESMPFTVRSIQVAVARLRASRPDETLNIPTEFEHYDTIAAWSFDPVGDWASDPPFAVLYQQRDPLGHSEKVLSDPKALVDYANFGGAIATWNANGHGRWAHSPGEWIVVEVELVQEQADDDD